jgi:ribosome-associated translation inhibitor RaiA
MKIKGKLVHVGETINVNDKFKKREIWLETQEQYPQTLSLQIASNKCDVFNGHNGQEIEVDINLKGRVWTNKDGNPSVFNTLEVWSWNVLGQAPQSAAVPNTLVGQAPESDFDF